MRKNPTISIAVLMAIAAAVFWVARNTEWTEFTVPLPPKGEAATNPFYAAQRFVERLSIRSSWDRELVIPSADAVLVVAAWHWDLTEYRRYAIERWVESGGRLVVVGPLSGGDDEFERWSGIARRRGRPEQVESPPAGCRQLEEFTDPPGPPNGQRTVCDIEVGSFLETARRKLWGLRDPAGAQVLRVAVGHGTVTVINGNPFEHREFLVEDHPWLFVAAAALRRRDELHFLSERDHPSLLALLWRHGSPAVALALVALALALWRNTARFGPLVEDPPMARRSLAEQIRGTGRFALRHGGGESLHAAAVRALDEVSAQRIAGYRSMPPHDRAAAIARITGFDRDALVAAVHHAGHRGAGELTGTLAFLENTRRGILDASRSRRINPRQAC